MRFFFLGLASLLSCVVVNSALSQSEPAKTPVSPITHTPLSSASPKAHPAVQNFEQFVVYWTDEAGWHTELQLRNNLISQDLIVTPTLRASNGTELVLAPVAVKPSDVVSIDLHEAAMAVDPNHIRGYGSLALRYQATVFHSLYAAVMVHDSGHPIAFHIDGYPQPKKFASGSREGIWWLPNGTAKDYLVLSNTGDGPLNVLLHVYDADGRVVHQNVLLAARETQRLSVRSIVQQAGFPSSFGGIEVHASKGAGYLDSAHVIFDESAGFAAIMKMFQHNPEARFEQRAWGDVKQWTTRAPMLALSTPDPALAFPSGPRLQPKVFVRNASNKSYAADIRFNWYEENSSGRSSTMNIPLKAHETRVIDLVDLQQHNFIPMSAHWASVIMSAPVQPDEMIAVAASYDSTLRYGAQTPFSDQLAAHWEGGKWEVDATHDSIITAGNGGNKPVLAQVTLFFDAGAHKYQIEQALGPNQQLWLDLAKTIAQRIPDKNGTVLPVQLTEGTYQFRDLTDPAVGDLFEGKIITDKTYGHAAYGCMICCGYPNGGFMWTDPLGLAAGSAIPQDVGATNSCSGSQDSLGTWYSTWGTGNTSVATAVPLQINGVGIGSTSDFTDGQINAGDGMTYVQSCPMQRDEPLGAVGVGQPAYLVGTNCHANPNMVFSGNWHSKRDNTCFLSQGLTVPSGGSCVSGGTTPEGTSVTCYQVTTPGCTTTYCPNDLRTIDGTCTSFLDNVADTVTKIPAGCQ